MSQFSRRGSKVIMQNTDISLYAWVFIMVMFFLKKEKLPDDAKEAKSKTLPVTRKSSKVTLKCTVFCIKRRQQETLSSCVF